MPANRFALARTSVLTFVSFLILSACGGGGGGGSSPPPPPPPPPPPTGLQPVQQTVSVTPPAFLNAGDTLSLVSAYTGVSTLLVTADTTLDRYEVDEYAVVVDQDDDIVMLGFLNPTGTQSLSPTSTALALLAAFPSLADAYSSDPAGFLSTIEGYPEVQALAAAIDTTAEWSTGADPLFVDTFATAVRRVYDAIGSGGVTSPGKPGRYERPAQDVDANRDPQSGVTVWLTSEPNRELSPEFELLADNGSERFVSIVVGRTGQHPGPAPQRFLLAPGAFEQFLRYSVEIIQPGNDVYAYGPGQGTLPTGLPQIEIDAFTDAGLASLIQYQVIPTTNARYDILPGCLNSAWFTTEEAFDTVQINVGSQTLRTAINEQLLQNEYLLAGLVATLGVEADQTAEIIECMVLSAAGKLGSDVPGDIRDAITNKFSQVSRLTPLFGAISDVLSLPDELDKVYAQDERFVEAIRASQTVEQWDVTNLQPDNPSNLTVSGYTSGTGAVNRVPFAGSCQTDQLCAAFRYPRVRPDGVPFNVDFTIACVDKDGEPALCRNVVLDYGDSETEGGTKADPSIPLNGEQRTFAHTYANTDSIESYTGRVSAADYDGAYADHDFALEIGEHVPRIELYVDDVLYEEGGDTPFICDSTNEPVSKQLRVRNAGLGALYFEAIPGLTVGDGFTLDLPFESGELAPGASTAPRTLTHDCAGTFFETDEWRVTLQDQFSDSFTQQFTFTVQDGDPLFENMLGTWHIYEDLFYRGGLPWGSACADFLGTVPGEDGTPYSENRAQIPRVSVTFMADGSTLWGFLAGTITNNGDGTYTCTLDGGYTPDGEFSGSWTYRVVNGVTEVYAGVSYTGGGPIYEPATEYEFGLGPLTETEHWVYRWVKQP